jgi:hypothetical protein
MKNIIKLFFHMTLNIKLYHWQTRSFARHRASDDLLITLLPLIDTFVETYSGRYTRPEFKDDLQIEVKQLDDTKMKALLHNYIVFLKEELPRSLKTNDTDLFNIRDDMISILNKTLYLFTLE